MRSKALAGLIVAAVAAGCAHASAVAHDAIPASYPEGPLWQGERLYYAEMGADRVSVFVNGAVRPFFVQDGCGPTAIAPYGEGFLVLCHKGGRVVAVDADGRPQRSWSADDAGAALMDPNDASADSHGGVYFSDPGAFSRHTRPHGNLMYLSASGALRKVAGPLWYPNGIYVDQAHDVLFVGEHMTGKIWRYRIGAEGAISDGREFVDIDALQRPARYDTPYAETGPDGMEIGPGGDLFVSIYGEGRILRLSPEGRLRGILTLPTRYSTNIAFDGGGRAATTGSFENIEPPYPGEVRLHTAQSIAESLTRAQD